jgi:choice-of-anchor C domain-containing protein
MRTIPLSILALFLGAELVAAPVPKPKPDQNLIANGSFEEGPEVESHKPLDKESSAIKGWTVTRGQIDFIGTFWKSGEGKHSVDFHGSPGYGGIKQSFSTTKGQKYKVTFSTAATPGVTGLGIIVEAASEKKTFKVESGNNSNTDMKWEVRTWEFTATDKTTTIEFYTTGEGGDNCRGPALDDVKVTIMDK